MKRFWSSLLLCGLFVAGAQAQFSWREEFSHLNDWNTSYDPSKQTIVDLGVVDPGLSGETGVYITGGGRTYNETHTDRTPSTGNIGFPANGETRYLYFWGVYNESHDTRIGGGFSTGDVFANELADGLGFHHLQSPDDTLLIRVNGATAASPTLERGDYDHRIVMTGKPAGVMEVTWEHKAYRAPVWTTAHTTTGSTAAFADRLVKLGVDNNAPGAYIDEIEFTDQDRLFKVGSQGSPVVADTSPFAITALVQSFASVNMNLSNYLGANMNTLLAFKADEYLAIKAANAQVPWQMHVDATAANSAWTSGNLQTKLQQYHNDYAGNNAWYTKDEPQFIAMADSAPVASWLQSTFPGSKVITNVLPAGASATKLYGDSSNPGYTYDQYLSDVISIIGPDVLMVDQYPFLNGGSTSHDVMHNTMSKVRSAAQANNMPYHIFVQAFKRDDLSRRLPSESDLRMQVFAAMTYGFTGISYFTYDPFGDYGGGDLTMVSPLGGPTPKLYDNIQALNAEIGILGKALGLMSSTEVGWIEGGVGNKPTGINDWTFGTGGDTKIQSISVLDAEGGGISEDEDGLIGFFEDDTGEDYFLLANMFHSSGTSSDDAELRFQIQFDSSVDQLLRLSRTTGYSQIVTLTGNLLDVTLPGGTGDLFKYATGNPDVFPTSTLAEWNLTHGGNWNHGTNWIPFGSPTNNTALFGDRITGPSTVFTDQPATLNKLVFDSSYRYLVAGGGGISLATADLGAPMIQVVSGDHEFQTSVTLLNDTTVEVADGSLLEFENQLSLGGNTLTKTGNGILAINNVLDSDGGMIDVQSGTVSGSGLIVGSLANSAGIISPGNSPGLLEIGGDFIQGAQGSLLIEIGGSEPRTDFDVLVVRGTANLGGQLTVGLLGDYQPGQGNTFEIMQFGESTGQFNSISLPGLSDGLAWDTSQIYATGTLSVIPEPTTVALLVGGFFGLLGSIHRQRNRPGAERLTR